MGAGVSDRGDCNYFAEGKSVGAYDVAGYNPDSPSRRAG